MAKIRICKEPKCNNEATTKGFCRLHYLKNWKTIKTGQEKEAATRLNKYIEHIIEQHPNRYIDVIKKEIKAKRFEKTANADYEPEMDDIYKLFNDPGYEEDIERLIKELKIEDNF